MLANPGKKARDLRFGVLNFVLKTPNLLPTLATGCPVGTFASLPAIGTTSIRISLRLGVTG